MNHVTDIPIIPPVGAQIISMGIKTEVVEQEFIFLNYPNNDGSWENALAWAEKFQLQKVEIGQFLRLLGDDFPMINIWGSNTERGSIVSWVTRGGGSGGGWFVFRKQIQKS